MNYKWTIMISIVALSLLGWTVYCSLPEYKLRNALAVKSMGRMVFIKVDVTEDIQAYLDKEVLP